MSFGPFCYFNNGLSFRAVSPDYIPQAGEVMFPNYASPGDLTAAFPNYLAALSRANAGADLATKLGQGIAITSTGTPALNSTYALDDLTLNQIGAVARDAAAGLGLPGGSPTFNYPDINAVMHTFTVASIQNLYKAMRDLVFQLQTQSAIQANGGMPTWPVQSATIP